MGGRLKTCFLTTSMRFEKNKEWVQEDKHRKSNRNLNLFCVRHAKKWGRMAAEKNIYICIIHYWYKKKLFTARYKSELSVGGRKKKVIIVCSWLRQHLSTFWVFTEVFNNEFKKKKKSFDHSQSYAKSYPGSQCLYVDPNTVVLVALTGVLRVKEAGQSIMLILSSAWMPRHSLVIGSE